MSFFFPKRDKQAEQAYKIKTGCEGCGLGEECTTRRMALAGKGRKGILVVTNNPTLHEDESGLWNKGKSTLILRKALKDAGVDLDKDCWRVNAVQCRPENGKPTPKQVTACNPRLEKAIRKLKPTRIILCGEKSTSSFLANRANFSGGMTKWRGWSIPDRDYKAWVFPTYSPQMVRNMREKEPVIQKLFEDDIINACVNYEDTPMPTFLDQKTEVKYLYEQKDIEHELERIMLQASIVTFDWETTGLRPYARNHRILTAGIASDMGVVAFPVSRKKSERVWLKRLMAYGIPKTGHNIAFEDQWSRAYLGVPVNNFVWDSQLVAHILDNRRGTTSLDFQVYVNFGLSDYSSHMKKWLQPKHEVSKAHGANAKNELDKFISKKSGMEQCLRYNGLDALFEYMLAMKQMEITGHDTNAYFS